MIRNRIDRLLESAQQCALRDFHDLTKPLNSEIARLEASGAFERRQSPNRI